MINYQLGSSGAHHRDGSRQPLILRSRQNCGKPACSLFDDVMARCRCDTETETIAEKDIGNCRGTIALEFLFAARGFLIGWHMSRVPGILRVFVVFQINWELNHIITRLALVLDIIVTKPASPQTFCKLRSALAGIQ
ncbi:hypothetical protein K503DRAFT_803231 [Rhizopogon vinicolor AM-OR11-026]|uniref:Uncharacterized protein n=1 Tax=Rhizopogon vinicolor AM-OR11-026 TaxID=1314800 RepID=A0A1B7MQM8_9AGAM|nr:hypothetical protein K503DRAFT_803231 [Rhizopogon vinicolor AM-OR11-026]